MKSISTRLVLDAGLALSVLFAPWWCSVALALLLIALFPAYEVIIAGVALDVLYAAPVPLFLGAEYVFTAGALVLSVIAVVLKERLLWYAR